MSSEIDCLPLAPQVAVFASSLGVTLADEALVEVLLGLVDADPGAECTERTRYLF